MKKIYLLLALLPLCGLLAAQQTITGSIDHDGQTRDYRLRIPPPSSDGQMQPLVFNLHGFGSNAVEQQVYSQMDAVADTAGFFVCYPNGRNNAWNVGWAFGSTADDVGFLSALIDTLLARHDISPWQVYTCGMSNGGFMSYRLACELNDRIAAAASVTGSMVPSYMGDCNPGRPVPVLQIHGTADQVVPYAGSPSISISMDNLLAFWTANNGCSDEPLTEELPNTNTNDGSTVTRMAYNDCADTGEVLFFRINGGAHTWPGAAIDLGVTNRDISGSEEIWHFFRQYALPGAPSNTLTGTPAQPMRMYPNPASDWLHFELPNAAPAQLAVFNATGQPVLQGAMPAQATLDLRAWPAGLYFVVVEQGGQRKAFKLIKP